MEKIIYELRIHRGLSPLKTWRSDRNFGAFGKGDLLRLHGENGSSEIERVEHELEEYRQADQFVLLHLTKVFLKN